MNGENIGIVFVLAAFIGAVIYGSTGESFPPVPLSEKAVYYPRFPAASAISP